MTTKKTTAELVEVMVAEQTNVAADKDLRTALSVVVEELASRVKQGRAAVQSFVERLQRDPAGSLGWADNVFQSAADIEVAFGYLAAIEARIAKGEYSGADILTTIRGLALLSVVDAARYPKRSTSPSSNQMDSERGAAQARVLQLIDDVNNHFDAK